MKKVILTFVFALFCLTLFNSLPGAFAGAPPRPEPITCYDPCTATTKPFFPYGWYTGWQTWTRDCNDCNTAGNHDTAGGNFVIAGFGPDEASWNNLIPVLDMARLYGKKVVVSLIDDFLFGVDPCDPNTYDNPADDYSLAKFVNAAKGHPALLGWLLGDENEWNMPAQDVVDSAYVINNILDGNHQVWQIFSGFDGVKQLPYLPGTSVYSDSTYPNHGNDDPNSFLDMENYLGPLYTMGQKAVENGASAAICTQGFGFDNAPPEFLINGVWRLPTHREHRWNVFSAIAAAGSRGTIYWTYVPSWYTDPDVFYAWLQSTAWPVFSEQEMIAHGMETGYNAGTVDANWTSKASDNSGGWTRNYDRITQLLLYDDVVARYFLIVTNNGPTAQNMNFTISNLPAPLANLNVLVHDGAGSNETITLTNLGGGSYRLNDTLQGFDVLIYRMNARKSLYFIGDNGIDWDTTSKISTGGSSNEIGTHFVNTINGSGISADGLSHNWLVNGHMWGSTGDFGVPHQWVDEHSHFIKYIFDKVYPIKEMWIWNWANGRRWYDGPAEGMKQVRILASTTDNQAGWTVANAAPVFEGIIPIATGTYINPVSLVVDFAGLQARSVLILSSPDQFEHNWSNGISYKDGLSEVRFYYEPVCSDAIAAGNGIASDLNGDCYVNFADLEAFAQDWLLCVDPQGCD